MKKLCIILGTRPEIIKLSPILRLCKQKKIPFFLIHTNQHFTPNMDRSFFEELHLPKAKYNLGIHEHLHGKMIGRMLIAIEKVLISEKPSMVLVQGDTNTVIAGALAASKLNIPLGHVEAGLRSYDRSMPEENNRIVTDHLSSYLFCPTNKQRDILLGEGISKKHIFVTGNTVVDAVKQNLQFVLKNTALRHYATEKFFLLTLHRPSNVDDPVTLKRIMRALQAASKEYGMPVYFPAHPRTAASLSRLGTALDPKRIVLLKPVSYFEMLAMEKYAQVVLTDSGGIQEEACIVHTPCVTIRENTERPETVEVGANILAGTSAVGIARSIKKAMHLRRSWEDCLGDGTAAAQILKRCV